MRRIFTYIFITLTILLINTNNVSAANDVDTCTGQSYSCIKCSYEYPDPWNRYLDNASFYYVVAANGTGTGSIIGKKEPIAKSTDNPVHIYNRISYNNFLTSNQRSYICPDLEIDESTDSTTGEMTIYISKATANSRKVIHGTVSESVNNPGSSDPSNPNVPTTTAHFSDNFEHNCADFAKTIRIGGILLLAAKIIIPIIIIIKAMTNMMSAITSGDQGEIKKNLSKLVISLVSAIAIFFIPMFVNTIMKMVTDTKGIDYKTADSEICRKCIFEPNSSECINGTSSSNSTNESQTDRNCIHDPSTGLCRENTKY